MPSVSMLAQIQNRLAHLDDNASGIPGRELSKLLYGRDSVFARNPTPEQARGLRCWPCG